MVLDVVFFVDYTLYNEPRCVYEYRYVVSRVCCLLVGVQSHASSHMFIGASSQIFIDAISHMFNCVISHMFINKAGSGSGTVGISASTLAAGKSLQRVLLHAFYAMLTLQMVWMLFFSKYPSNSATLDSVLFTESPQVVSKLTLLAVIWVLVISTQPCIDLLHASRSHLIPSNVTVTDFIWSARNLSTTWKSCLSVSTSTCSVAIVSLRRATSALHRHAFFWVGCETEVERILVITKHMF